MNPSLLKAISDYPDLLPACENYRDLLDIAREKTGDSYDHLRAIAGDFTYAQLAKFLGI